MNLMNTLTKETIVGPPVRATSTADDRRKSNAIPLHFSEFFIPQVATSEDAKRGAFQLRHDVYCEELNLEKIQENGLETDEFDANAIHLLIQNIASKKYAGTARLVRTSSQSELLPIEKFCKHSFYPDNIQPSSFPRETVCEISRLAVSSEFRKRAGDKFEGAAAGAINAETYSEIEMRCFPFITIGLYLEIVAVCEKVGIEHFFVMMEPKLARSASFAGIKFHQIGEIVEYHGRRAAYYINLEMFHKNVSSNLHVMLADIRRELDRQGNV